jgi:hypothetical protein
MMHTGLCYNVKWQNGGGSLQSALMTNTSHEISMSIDTTKKKKKQTAANHFFLLLFHALWV